MGILDFLRRGDPHQRFAKLCIERLRARGWQGAATYAPERFVIDLGDGGAMFLHNAYRAWCDAGDADKAKQIDIIVGSALEVRDSGWETDFAAAAPCLLPIVRHRDSLSSDAVEPGGAERPSYAGALRPLCADLVALVAVDLPNSIQLVQDALITGWGQSFDDVMAVAVDNLRSLSPAKFVRHDGGFHVSDYRDMYDASRILLPALFASLPLRGEPVAVVLSRSGIVVAGSDDSAALAAMAAFVEDVFETEQRPISCAPIVLREGIWSAWDGDDAALRRLGVRQRLRDCAEQKAVLDARFERSGRDVFVASLNAVDDQGALRTFAVWSTDVITLLPQADALIIGSHDGPRLARAWSDVVAMLGPFAPEAGHRPPRYLVERGPAPEDLAQLALRAPPAWIGDID